MELLYNSSITAMRVFFFIHTVKLIGCTARGEETYFISGNQRSAPVPSLQSGEDTSLLISYSTEAAMCLAVGIVSLCVFMYLHIVGNLAVGCIFSKNWEDGEVEQTAKLFR